jgi:hypothetical protein
LTRLYGNFFSKAAEQVASLKLQEYRSYTRVAILQATEATGRFLERIRFNVQKYSGSVIMIC